MKKDESEKTTLGQLTSVENPTVQARIKPRLWILIYGGVICLAGIFLATLPIADLIHHPKGLYDTDFINNMIFYSCLVFTYVLVGALLIILERRASACGKRSRNGILIFLGTVLLIWFILDVIVTNALSGGRGLWG